MVRQNSPQPGHSSLIPHRSSIMSYQETATKKMINSFLASRAGSRALVIDGEGLCSARTLTQMDDITVLNDDVEICRAAESAGFKAACGVSTLALRGLSGKFDIIYLDYCGFPRRRSDGFDPAFDLLWAADHLTPGGIVMATFHRRATNCIATAEGLIPLGLQLAKSYVSNEAICLIMVANDSRSTRDAFNAHVTMSEARVRSPSRSPCPRPKP